MKIQITGKRYNYLIHVEKYYIILHISGIDQPFEAYYDFLKHYGTSLLDVDPSLFRLMIKILMWNMDEIMLDDGPVIPQTGKPIVSFSGGVDSAALLYMSPHATPVHIVRLHDLNYDNRQIRACKWVSALTIETNFELVRKHIVGSQGFNVGIGYTCMYVPIMQLIGTDTVEFSVVFDDLAFHYGAELRFNDQIRQSTFHRMKGFCQLYGIDIRFPIAGYSEVLTTRIADSSGIRGFSSCHTVGDKDNCMACYKCFRKQGIRGRKIQMNDRIMRTIKKKPLKMASSAVYAMQKAGYKGLPFTKFTELDVDFCNRINPYYDKEFGYGLAVVDVQTLQDQERIYKFVNDINLQT